MNWASVPLLLQTCLVVGMVFMFALGYRSGDKL